MNTVLVVNHRRCAALRWLFLAPLAWAACVSVAALEWPQEITTDEGTIVVYQPQPESLTGNLLKSRAAMALELKDRAEPIFGAFWFDARVDTDRDAGTALIRDIRVTQVRWPDSKDASEQRFTAVVEAAVPENGFEISLDQLSASLDTAQIERKSLEALNTDPPVILFRDELAVLLLYDGEPRFSPVENSTYERALNTPFVVVRDGRGAHWLSSGVFWYRANGPMGPWAPNQSPPGDLVRMLPATESDGASPDAPPVIVTADVPTELVVTQGKPDWQSLPGGQLLYVQNTETPWLRELATGNMYVLLSGRWYRARGQDGPWTFVRADELPASFKDIPPASDLGGLRTSVAGTPEADDAVLDAQIPQTAAIKRSEATLDVEYDGKPEFTKIPGTRVAYAVNTGAQVLEIDGRYYAVDNGVWFVAGAATGPWQVADEIPSEEIQKIPPSSPVYNTTYVQIYQSTPEVVYVGYTPGYLWSFPYYGVPVYGTGWYYPPYYGRWYYPRPPTWGFNVGYNPWTGWNFGMSWSNGFFSFGVSWGGGWGGAYRPWGCCGGWYGGGYRRPVVINTGDINIGNSISVGNRTNIGNRIERETNLNLDRSRTNLYNRPETRARNADRATAARNLKQARPAPARGNDVFADKDGRVARRVDDSWETRRDGKWTRDDAGPETREAARSAVQARTTAEQREQATVQQRSSTAGRPAASDYSGRSSFDRAGLNRANQARQRGATRQMSRPSNLQGTRPRLR